MLAYAKQALAALVFRPFFKFRASGAVRSYYNRGAAALQRASAGPQGVLRRVADTLRQDGIVITHLDELFPGGLKLEELRAYAESLRPKGRVRDGKPFLMALWQDDEPLSWDNPFTPVALSTPVLSVANEYLGVFSRFYYHYLDITMPVGSSAPMRSQNWHRDPEDKKMCKMFIYLSDVDEDAGPFTYIRGSHVDGKYSGVAPQKPPKGSYPDEEAVWSAIPRGQLLVCTGKAGTVIFADTAGLHRGGHAKTKERWMYTSGYSAPSALRPPLTQPSSQMQIAGDETSPASYALAHDYHVAGRVLNWISDSALKHGLY